MKSPDIPTRHPIPRCKVNTALASPLALGTVGTIEAINQFSLGLAALIFSINAEPRSCQPQQQTPQSPNFDIKRNPSRTQTKYKTMTSIYGQVVRVSYYDIRRRPQRAPFYVSGLGSRNSPHSGEPETLKDIIDRINLDKWYWDISSQILSNDCVVYTPDLGLSVLLQAAAALGPGFNHITAQSIYVPPQVSSSMSTLIVRSMLIL